LLLKLSALTDEDAGKLLAAPLDARSNGVQGDE
jgi:hypothetical protein